ncbi:MAG: sodium:solute symporter family protein [Verrucomicrobiae bacterium]|nr:sodium:solute symporter family protein [Verrucomicrobiae bacterium]
MITARLEPLDVIVVAAYLTGMIAIGFWVSTRIRKFKDYFLASGALTTPLLVCTLVSTYYEIDVTFATAEQGYYRGLVAWFWWSRPYYIAIFIAAVFLARRLKKFQFMTLPDVMQHHYGKWARVSSAVACLLYSLPVTALMGMGVVFGAFGVSPSIGILVGVLVCLTYTAVGGLWADAITDTIQFVLMCLTLAIVVVPALKLAGGFEGVRSHLPAAYLTHTGGVSGWLLLAWCCLALTVFVEPAFYQRIFAAKDVRQVTRALLIGIFLWAAYDWAVTIVGMAARAAVETGVFPRSLEGKQAVLAVAAKALPVGLKGAFLAGVLAAAMSSVDTYALLASSNLVYDILRPLFRPQWDDRRLILLTRFGIALILVPSVLLALVYERVEHAWVLLASVLVSATFVPIFGSLLCKPKPHAGLWASVCGLVALVAFQIFIHTQGTWNEEEQSYVFVKGAFEIWREYAVLFALPASLAGFVLGQFTGRNCSHD